MDTDVDENWALDYGCRTHTAVGSGSTMGPGENKDWPYLDQLFYKIRGSIGGSEGAFDTYVL